MRPSTSGSTGRPCGEVRLRCRRWRPAPGCPVEVDIALAELHILGIVTEEGGHWAGIAPERAIEVLIQREEEQLRARQERLHTARSSIPTLVADYVLPGRSQCRPAGVARFGQDETGGVTGSGHGLSRPV